MLIKTVIDVARVLQPAYVKAVPYFVFKNGVMAARSSDPVAELAALVSHIVRQIEVGVSESDNAPLEKELQFLHMWEDDPSVYANVTSSLPTMHIGVGTGPEDATKNIVHAVESYKTKDGRYPE